MLSLTWVRDDEALVYCGKGFPCSYLPRMAATGLRVSHTLTSKTNLLPAHPYQPLPKLLESVLTPVLLPQANKVGLLAPLTPHPDLSCATRVHFTCSNSWGCVFGRQAQGTWGLWQDPAPEDGASQVWQSSQGKTGTFRIGSSRLFPDHKDKWLICTVALFLSIFRTVPPYPQATHSNTPSGCLKSWRVHYELSYHTYP
jgi:hypothetical protein